MTPDPFSRVPASCDAFQEQLSEIADSGAAPGPDLRAHLERCDECARFAEQWLTAPPPELARSILANAADPLRERILDAATLPRISQFRSPPASRLPWAAWLGRIAAGLAVAGFAYWLLNPAASPVGNAPATASAPTLTQGLAQMENRTKHEQALLRTALADGGREVRGNVLWSVSALEL
jgi:hypothetical protein